MGEKRKRKRRVTSTKLPLRREFSAGGAVFKKNKDKTTWLIVKVKDIDRWQLPKGIIDKGETSQEAALREVKEEGGVIVRIIEKLGTIQYFFVFEGQRIFKTVTYFLMKFEKKSKHGIDEEEIDEALFTSFEDAFKKLTFKADKEILVKAKEKIDRGIQPNLV